MIAAGDRRPEGPTMFSRFFKTKLEWRRTAVYEPLLLEGAVGADEEIARQSLVKQCQIGQRVSLRREPSVAPDAVAVLVGDDRLIGYLPRQASEWVGPLLGSGVAALDAEIWSLERTRTDAGREALECRLLLTQHDMVPVARFALTHWLFRDRKASDPVAFARGVRDSG
jgi:HIRAN domain